MMGTMKPNGLKWRYLSSSAFLLAATVTGQAAVLTLEAIQPYPSTMSTPVNLTTQGDLDWAYWAGTGASALTTRPPTNSKSGATAISDLEAMGGASGSTLRGSSSGTATANGRYSWSGDGTASGLTSGSNVDLPGSLIFNSTLGNSTTLPNANGAGFSLTVAGDPLATRYVTLYFGGFGITGELTVTLNGATTIVDTSQTFPVNDPKYVSAYQIAFRPDSASDLLTIQYLGSAASSGSSHVGIEAVTYGTAPAIPEPAAIALGGIGGLFLIGKRRR